MKFLGVDLSVKKDTIGNQKADLVFQLVTNQVPCSKLIWQQKMDLVKMYLLLKMVMFHCYVSLPEGICDFFSFLLED